MKKKSTLSLLLCLCIGLAGCASIEDAQAGGFTLWSVVLVLLGLCVLAFAALRTWQFIQYRQRMRRRKTHRRPQKNLDPVTWALYGAGAVLLLAALMSSCAKGSDTGSTTDNTQPSTTVQTTAPVLFTPEKTADSDPASWGISWEILDGSSIVDSYTRAPLISFGDGNDYFALPGIATFRGNNYRNSATYGTADVSGKTLSTLWTSQTSILPASGWDGSGWTGQPLLVQWDDATRSIMNLYENKKAKSGLVEVIYATLDGHIYFLDLEDGSYTRDSIDMGMCFKGAGSLDPRGYPLMYVGAGDVNGYGVAPRFYIISLIDGSILYEYGNADPLALRKDNDNWCAFDSAPLVDADTDTLIWPGENGILYTFKLNTRYDRDAGTISISPDAPVSTRYTTARSGEDDYWLGYEASASIVDGFLYVSENGGMFYCVDLNTMELVWAQDTVDDSNSSPVFQSNGSDGGYIYTAPSLHWTQDESARGAISIYKLDALTGSILWQKPYDVYTVDGVSGGVQSTPLLGRSGSSIDGLVIYTIARTPKKEAGLLVALDTDTGEEVWRWDMPHYAWSSPVAFYSEDGSAYIVVCDSAGDATLIDGATGQILHSIDLGFLVEASPAVFGDTLVVGTRGKLICGVKIQ